MQHQLEAELLSGSHSPPQPLFAKLRGCSCETVVWWRGLQVQQFSFSAFHWSGKQELSAQHDFEEGTAWRACTWQSLRPRACSALWLWHLCREITNMAGAEGLDISSSACTPEENRNTTLNCCAQDSRIAFSLWRTQRKARSWRVGTTANRIQSALETVQLLLGPYEIYLLHCSFYLCHILVHKLKLFLLLFLFVEISFNHFLSFPCWVSPHLCSLYRLSCYLCLLLGLCCW